MKKQYYLLLSALLLTGTAQAQGTELFFSEYNEGAHQNGTSYNGGVSNSTGNEKAIEIFNPTTSAVNLNPYSIRRYSNGAPLGSPLMEEERLMRRTGANVLNSRAVHVVAHPEVTLTEITSVVSQYSAPRQNTPTNPATSPNVIQVGGTVHFNGDDAMALVRYPSGTAGQPNVSAGIIIDIIGSIGEQPLLASGGTGTGNWSGTNPADGTPAVFVLSANQSIMRRPSVSSGVRVNPAPQNVPGSNPPVRNPGGYNIANEWMMYGTAFNGPMGANNPGGQLYDRLGEHLDYTGPFGAYQTTISSTLEKFNNNISIYPNPAHGSATVQIKDANVGSVVVLNNLGQRISAQPKGTGQENITLDISSLKAGLYFVQFVSTDGQTKVYKELVVQ
ncbi:T9SS type A sorting domain-containing protein [Hymenobacter saemangeumensis]